MTFVAVLAYASMLLATFITVTKAESQYLESADVLSAQITVLGTQLASAEQELQLRQILTLQNQQNATVSGGSQLVLLCAVVSGALIGLLMWLFLRQKLIKPMRQLAKGARQLQSDDTAVIISHLQRTDEVGVLSSALESFRLQCLSVEILKKSVEQSQQELNRAIDKQARNDRDFERSQAKVLELEKALARAQLVVDSEAELQQRILQLSNSVSAAGKGHLSVLSNKLEREHSQDDPLGRMGAELGKLFTQFDRDFISINSGANQLAVSATNLQELGEIISCNAGGNNEKAQNILSGAKNVRSVLLQISSNVEQMESGIEGISSNATQASSVAAQAVELAKNTSGTMRKLADSSVDINNVIKLITTIAEQTNLLALNATIEAARAGDAGKGFAVVANEVKELAKETNKATDEIQRRITAIRTETGNAVEAIGNINQIVSQIDGLQGDISDSVRDQSSAVQAIISMIGNATKDNSTVREILAKMLEVLGTTQTSAENIQRSSQLLRTDAEDNLKITRRYIA